MRILQVCPRYPPQTGGVETHVEAISERLVERGHEVTVRTADGWERGHRREVRNGVTVHRHRGWSPGGAFHLAPGVWSAVRRSAADVVHAHNYHSLPLFVGALGVTDARFVVTPHYHGGSADAVRDRMLSLYRPLGGWAIRRAECVVAVSDWERDRLREVFGVEAVVIPNGVAVERFRTADREERERPYLLCVGRLEKYKGVQHVIRALVELEEYDLVVTGSGPYRENLERLAREEGVPDRVEFVGYVESERLPGLYNGAEVFLNLSSFEAYGITIAEALAAGTPCVVLASGALADWTGRMGVVGIDEVGPSKVRGAILEARDIDPAQDMLATWGEVTDRLERTYRE